MYRHFLYFYLLFTANLLVASTTGQLCVSAQKSENSYFSATSTIRALAIFVKFRDDGSDLSPYTDTWPATSTELPEWAADLLAPSIDSRYKPGGVTHFFDEMSMGKFHMIGDVYPKLYITPEYESYYSVENGKGIGYLNRQILEDIDAHVNFADYDNMDPEDIDADGIIEEPDGKVDMVFMIYRLWRKNLMARYYQGVAGLDNNVTPLDGEGPNFFPISLDGVAIAGDFPGSGVVVNNEYNLPHSVLLHEIAHYLFGAVHFPGIGRFGLMDGIHGGATMSGFERIKLGWAKPKRITSNQMNVAIPDALTTGTVFMIEFTGKNYFLIENRQAVSYYETTSKLATHVKGILITHVTNSNIDVECADGKWLWRRDGLNYLFPFMQESEDSHYGRDEMDLLDVETGQGRKTHTDAGGDAQDIFSLSENRQFTPWTNPSSNHGSRFTDIAVILKHQAGETIYADMYRNLPPAAPANLTISNPIVDGNIPLLEWRANMEPDLATYAVYHGFRKSDSDSIIWNATATDMTKNTTWRDHFIIIDNSAPSWVHYRIAAIDNADQYNYSNIVGVKSYMIPEDGFWDFSAEKAMQLELLQNYPNPFNSDTVISFTLPENAEVRLTIFNVLGQEVRTLVDGRVEAGYRQLNWDSNDRFGKQLPSGMYFVTLTGKLHNSNFKQIKKLIITR
jgi:M6 family metalloprotease-like protein